MSEMGTVEIFTDGSCSGNPGPGGWGVLLRNSRKTLRICGGDPATTNNRMELTAAIEGLRALKRPCHVTISTDSQYLMRGAQSDLARWKSNGWKLSGGKPVANQDLWEALHAAMAGHEVTWVWVKGHAGHPENELADKLARKGCAEALRSAA